MLRVKEVRAWREALAKQGHFIDDEVALTIANFWDYNQGQLTLEGPPGGGKTQLALKIALAKNAPLYRLQCFKDLGKRQALYDWDSNIQNVITQTSIKNGQVPDDINEIIYTQKAMVSGQLIRVLLDPNPDKILLIDELDKIPQEQAFEALLLEYLEENAISVPETGERIVSASGKPPHTIITSNAGNGGLVASLSQPVLRRGAYLYVPEPSLSLRQVILENNAPKLSNEFIRCCVLFTDQLNRVVRFVKRIAISEIIMWVGKLQLADELHTIKELTEEIISLTMFELVKNIGDRKRALDATKRVLAWIQSQKHKDLLQLDKELGYGVNDEEMAGGVGQAA